VAEAGIEPRSVVTAVGDEKIETSGDLISALREYQPGDTVEMTLASGDEAREVTVEYGRKRKGTRGTVRVGALRGEGLAHDHRGLLRLRGARGRRGFARRDGLLPGGTEPWICCSILGIVSIFAGRSAMLGSHDAELIKESTQDTFSSGLGCSVPESSPDDCTGPLAVRLFGE